MRAPRMAMVAYTHFATDPRCRREAALAVAAGWDVHFYALSGNGCRDLARTEGIALHELPVGRYRGESAIAYLWSYLCFLFLASVRLLAGHLRRRFAIVHVNTMPDFMVFSALLPRLLGARVILDIHDVMPELFMGKFHLPATHWKIRIVRTAEVLSARVAHEILTATDPAKQLLVSHGIPAGKIRVLLNLPDEEIFGAEHLRERAPAAGPWADGDDFRLVYHGTLVRRLGLDHAVNAVAQLSGRMPDLKMGIFGEGDELPELRRLIETLDLNGHVWISDRLRPIEEILPSLRAAHLGVIPTRRDVSTECMLPTKLLEYLALGVPFIVSPTRAVRHYFGEEQPFYLGEISPEGVAAKIVWAREHYEELRALTGEVARSFFCECNWENHKKIYVEMLGRLSRQGGNT